MGQGGGRGGWGNCHAERRMRDSPAVWILLMLTVMMPLTAFQYSDGLLHPPPAGASRLGCCPATQFTLACPVCHMISWSAWAVAHHLLGWLGSLPPLLVHHQTCLPAVCALYLPVATRNVVPAEACCAVVAAARALVVVVVVAHVGRCLPGSVAAWLISCAVWQSLSRTSTV